MPLLHYVDTPSFELEVAPSLKTSGWKLVSFNGTQVDILHNPTLDRHLAQSGSLKFRISGHQFKDGDPTLIKAIVDAAISKGKSVFNSPKIRISSDPTIGMILDLSPTDYFQGLATNEIAFKTATVEGMAPVNGTELAFPGNVITSLADSRLSNHVGACALAFDINGVLSLVKTGKASMISAQKLAPSAAGSADAADFQHGNDDLTDCILSGLKRELLEEQGITESDIVVARLIGFQRFIPRGAKPEFIGFIRIGNTWKNARKGISAAEAVFTEEHLDLDCVALGLEGLHAWLKENDALVSFSVKQCFYSLFNIVRTDAELKALISG